MARHGIGYTGMMLLTCVFALGAMSLALRPAPAFAESSENAPTGEEHNYAQAENLVPKSDAMGWYAPMLYSVLGLFVAAIVVGVARDAAGMKDPGIAAGEYDQAHAHHDDHGDDSHGHDAHGYDDHAHGHKH